MLHKVENLYNKFVVVAVDLSRECLTHHTRELIIGMGDLNGHVGRIIDGFHGGFGIGKRNQEGRMLL